MWKKYRQKNSTTHTLFCNCTNCLIKIFNLKNHEGKKIEQKQRVQSQFDSLSLISTILNNVTYSSVKKITTTCF